MSETSVASLLADLTATFAEWKHGHGKTLSIIKSSSALVSLVASTILIRMITVSPTRLTTTYHRLLLGISIGDIIFSLGNVSFNSMIPSEMSYLVWNAQGNATTCSMLGFLLAVGAGSTIFYSCSINLFYLAKVRYNKSDVYIRSKIEPILHGIPIGLSLLPGIILLVKQNFNDDGNGNCFQATYNPPHCIGYEDGHILEGFDIPCGRGSDGVPTFFNLVILVYLFIPPIITGVSLGMIYKQVHQQEKRVAKYGAGDKCEF